MNSAKSQKLVLGVLGAVVFLVVFYQFSWKARANTLNDASSVRTEIQAKQADVAAAKKAKAQEPANRAALAQVQAVLPSSSDAQGVIRTLTALASSSSINWKNVTIGQAPATPAGATTGLQSLPLTVSISGTITNVETYLANVRKSNIGRIITVDGVTTTFNVEPTAPDVIDAVLTMRAFTYAIDGTVTATTTTVPPTSTNTVTSTPVGTVPTAVTEATIATTPTTVAFQG
jgi:Tfp pilus assembly protein PilO